MLPQDTSVWRVVVICWEDLTPQSPLYCKHSSFRTPCGCNDLPKALLPLGKQAEECCAVTDVPVSLLCMQDALWQPSEWRCGPPSSSLTGSG